MPSTLISVVIPVYCGSAYVEELVSRLTKLRHTLSGSDLELVECIFVDDESTDDSGLILQAVTGDLSWVHVITMSRNFGQHAATVAGIQHTSGDWVVTLDEDLQHDPAEILLLLRQGCLRHGDIVYGAPKSAVHQSFFRDVSSRTAKFLVGTIARNPHIRKFSSFRMMRGNVARATAASCATETYFDVATTWFTNRISVLYLEMKDGRFIDEKRSGYTLPKLLNHAKRLFLTADTPITRYGLHAGVLAMLVALAGAAIVVYSKLYMPESIPVKGWASLMAASLFMFGVLSFQTSLIIKYQSMLMYRAQGRPTYFSVDRSKDEDVIRALNSISRLESDVGDASQSS